MKFKAKLLVVVVIIVAFFLFLDAAKKTFPGLSKWLGSSTETSQRQAAQQARRLQGELNAMKAEAPAPVKKTFRIEGRTGMTQETPVPPRGSGSGALPPGFEKY